MDLGKIKDNEHNSRYIFYYSRSAIWYSYINSRASMIMASRGFKKSSIEGGHYKEVEELVSTNEVNGYIKFNDNTNQILISPKFNPIKRRV